MKSLKFAFIQSGYCVFGVGYTEEQAISDARKWLEGENGVQGGLSWRETRALLSDDRDSGFALICSHDDEFDSYLKNQGGFVKRGKGWYRH
mgnify:CR=1 FL=1